ncbi:MAG: hypothetical protein H6839_11530 [Planctomycetes bacterium]|nr:hypothetical protein [Planctomycetota bacterium]
MTLLAWPAILMLSTAAILIALAAWRQGPKQREVGTLLIWRRVAQQHQATQQRRRNFDLLLWLLLAGVVVGAIAATRPAWLHTQDHSRVAVFVEPTGPGIEQANLDEVKARVEADLPGAIPTFFLSTKDGGVPFNAVTLGSAGPPASQISDFERHSTDYDARLLMLNQPTTGTEDLGRAIPRLTKARPGVVFHVTGSVDRLLVQASAGLAPSVTGATLVSSSTSADSVSYLYEPTGVQIEVSDAIGKRTYRRRPFGVGTGNGWTGDAHEALLKALQLHEPDGRAPQVWLGSDELKPAVRVSAGEDFDLTTATLAWDPQHALLRDLPLGDFDWLGEGKLLAPTSGVQPLVTAVVDGKPVGDLVRLRDSGKVLEFAGDPFSRAPVASAALLLDNAIGVVSGVRPSERTGYELSEGPELPTRRQALAAPFEPYGELDLSSRSAAPLEFSTWLCLAAGLLLLLAATIAARKENPRPKPGVVG